MLPYTKPASSTNIHRPSASYTGDKQETTSLPSPIDLGNYVSLCVGYCRYMVTPMLKEGYFAARKVYVEMEEQNECGACLLLTGYKFAHLTRKYIPAGLSFVEKQEWQRGFIAGWNASTFGL